MKIKAEVTAIVTKGDNLEITLRGCDGPDWREPTTAVVTAVSTEPRRKAFFVGRHVRLTLEPAS